MNLYVIRHADAERSAHSDFDRRLTDKGRGQAKRLGRFLAVQNISPTVLLTSPLVRARETAEIAAAELGAIKTLRIDERLASGMRPEQGCDLLREHFDEERVFVVGHNPDLAVFCAWLCGMADASIEMKKGACACFATERPARGGGVLRWLIPPKLLP